MTFTQARKEFAKLCPGRYRCMHYDLVDHSEGTAAQKCRLYVDSGISTAQHATWREALDEMHGLIKPEDKPEPEITTPQGDEV